MVAHIDGILTIQDISLKYKLLYILNNLRYRSI